MITAGIDMGSKNIKVVILKDGEMIGKGLVLAGFDSRKSAEEAFALALEAAGIKMEDINSIVATGAGRNHAPYTEREITEVGGNAAYLIFQTR